MTTPPVRQGGPAGYMDRAARTMPWLYGAVTVVELVAVAIDGRVLQWFIKPSLMPLLIGYLLLAARPAWRTPILTSLAFATAGDIVLLFAGDAAFLIGMGCFLGTQLCYLTAFLRHGRPRPAMIIGYGLLWIALNVTLWSRLGPLRLPILIYSLALTSMAVTATAVSRRVAVGGALFLLSDLLIGLGASDLRIPAHGVAVMVTYTLAQFLIVTGWVARGRSVTYPTGQLSGRTPETSGSTR